MKIKVMSFNMRMATEKDGNNSFWSRKEKILKTLAAESPDVIGFQEITDEMLAWLKTSLNDYYVLGHGRSSNYRGEAVPVAYRREFFDLHSYRTEWLSADPACAGSRLEGLDQSPCPRMYVCAELRHKECDRPFAFFNVHTDHQGELARIAETTQLCRALHQTRFGFVLVGDFNAKPDSKSIAVITSTAATLGTRDITSHIKGTFHGFLGEVGDKKIDYIFTNLPSEPDSGYAVLDDDAEGYYYSDHHALCAYVEI